MDNHNKLSVVYATRNEEENIGRSIKSIKNIADEIIVVDENSTDNTCLIAKKLGAKVYTEPHHEIFHITKQKALDLAKGDWVLQMDADEEVTPELANQILAVIAGQYSKLDIHSERAKLFNRHQDLIEQRDGKLGNDNGKISAFFIPRVNMFLGHPMKHGGVYPDGVIRLVKNGKAWFPQKSVHEQIHVDGRVEWLMYDLNHYDSPTLKRYLSRFNRYTDLQAADLQKSGLEKKIGSYINFVFIKPLYTFINIFFRHKGFLDGVPGFLWAFFSSMHFPIAYFKYISKKDNI